MVNLVRKTSWDPTVPVSECRPLSEPDSRQINRSATREIGG